MKFRLLLGLVAGATTGAIGILSAAPESGSANKTAPQQAPPRQPAATPVQPPIPAPFVSAKTNMVSSKTVTEPGSLNIGGLTLSQSQPQREMSVTVSVQFFSPPPGPFEVQCFFMAKNETTKTRYIFNVVGEESKKPTFSDEIHSGTLLGAKMDWIGIPLSLPASIPKDGGTLVDSNGKPVESDTKLGSKIEGWILRVVYQGRVLKVDANQPHLAELANRLPKLFDQAATGK